MIDVSDLFEEKRKMFLQVSKIVVVVTLGVACESECAVFTDLVGIVREESLFLLFSEFWWARDIEISFGFGLSFVYILPSMPSALWVFIHDFTIDDVSDCLGCGSSDVYGVWMRVCFVVSVCMFAWVMWHE